MYKLMNFLYFLYFSRICKGIKPNSYNCLWSLKGQIDLDIEA